MTATSKTSADLITSVASVTGLSLTARIVTEGERYGLDRCLIHNEPAPMVEFYNATRAGQPGFDPLGVFVSRYYVSTILGSDGDGSDSDGLCLDGVDCDMWMIGAAEMDVVRVWLGVNT